MAAKKKVAVVAKKPGSLAEFEKKYSARRTDVNEAKKLTGAWPTGSFNLDKALRGGFARGKLVEIYGPPGGGKTTLALCLIAQALKLGKKCCYFDLERGLDLMDGTAFDDFGFIDPEKIGAETPEHVQSRTNWLKVNGINPDDPNFHIYNPESGEELFEMLAAIVAGKLFSIVVIDSVPAIVPRRTLEGNVGDATYGNRAKLLAEEIPRLLHLYGGNYETTIVFINQVRENIGAQVKSQKSTSGYALEHYVRVKVKVQRIFRREQGDDVVADTRVKIEKNVYGPAGETMIRISGKRGIDTIFELKEFAVDFGYVHLSGNWHYIFGEPITPETFAAAQASKTITSLPGFLLSANGEGAALAWMSLNGWQDKLYPLALKTL